VKEKTMTTKITLSDKASEALRGALVTRGKRYGNLLASAPRSDSLAYAAWLGAMVNFNPFKVSIAGVLFMSDEQRAIYEEVKALFSVLPGRATIDKDRKALESLGVW
jgi:hypothetical protein